MECSQASPSCYEEPEMRTSSKDSRYEEPEMRISSEDSQSLLTEPVVTDSFVTAKQELDQD